MTAEHARTPWELTLGKDEQGRFVFFVIMPGDSVRGMRHDVASISLDRFSRDIDHVSDRERANAAFIIKAVNAHDELVAALANILAFDAEVGIYDGFERDDAYKSEAFAETLKQARSILSKLAE